jgi:hypothetical protein
MPMALLTLFLAVGIQGAIKRRCLKLRRAKLLQRRRFVLRRGLSDPLVTRPS